MAILVLLNLVRGHDPSPKNTITQAMPQHKSVIDDGCFISEPTFKSIESKHARWTRNVSSASLNSATGFLPENYKDGIFTAHWPKGLLFESMDGIQEAFSNVIR